MQDPVISIRELAMGKKIFKLVVCFLYCLPVAGVMESMKMRLEPLILFVSNFSLNEAVLAEMELASHFIWEEADPTNNVSEVDWQEVQHHATSWSRVVVR